jgi:hypothetical protein
VQIRAQPALGLNQNSPGTSNIRKFEIKTMIFLKMNNSKKGLEIFLAIQQ